MSRYPPPMDPVHAWLLEGDPAIRWQAMRDLLDAPEVEWQTERAKLQSKGNGKRYLDLQDKEGTWAGGIYTPKWTSTTYTLLHLREMGFSDDCPAARRGAERILDQLQRSRELGMCTCVVGMWLALTVRFGLRDEVQDRMIVRILEHQFEDGGWNCRWPRIAKTHHSSFHTTLNVLDGVRECLENGIGPSDDLRKAEARAVELLLQHGLFRSDRTGNVINAKFKEPHFPPRWHYDFLRALEFMRTLPAIKDRRLAESFELLESQRREDGRWPAAKGYGGVVFFPVEDGRQGSRWNTLRALRCLRARAA
ncbi:MAG TPA: hypothetical protein PLX06_11845 [Fimbriimonadaceae bacterium]|nr:hypothetical protein [Fimbriimonadaceae bacterium]